MNSIQREESSRGGLAVVIVCFFAFGFLLSLLIQALLYFGQAFQVEQVTDLSSSEEFVAEAPIKPDPRFSPREVVAYQLEGLGSADRLQGINQCFVFASPANKSMTGPISRFAKMVQRPPYDVLLSPQELLIGSPDIHDDHATVTVSLLDSLGGVQVFQFVLSKQIEGDCSGCWMTEAVFPLRSIDSREPARPPTVMHSVVPKSQSMEI
ncbi:DUF4864 domain-containing protein [Bythopirellula polymerisocia]|uniref:DUF4864 domain-containing protein n=1 Tax=Bythopirellula polymerisocia TaxID=2528003 RepID=A0A5C6CHP6_9BACT|nr:hypothetical protein [Bythopirellula polymerisocia]TWU23545.1 hypothetical protein Pla144_37200 [Bythopirellula polymerisocia]